MIRAVVLTTALLGACQIQEKPRDAPPVPQQKASALAYLHNDTIQFERTEQGVQIMGPPEAVALSQREKLQTLDELVDLLADPERVWAAEVMLSAMSGHDDFIAKGFDRAQYLANYAKGAEPRWRRWLDKNRSKLVWDGKRYGRR